MWNGKEHSQDSSHKARWRGVWLCHQKWPKNEKAGRMPALQKRNASLVARRSTQREYYIAAMMLSKVKSSGLKREIKTAQS